MSQGQATNHKRMVRLIRELGLMGKRPIKRKRTTNSNHEFGHYPNRMMDVTIDHPDQAGVVDVMYIKLQQEFGQAWQNGYAERLMRMIKEEEVDLLEYRNFTEAYQQIEEFLEDVYMKKRIHSSLGYLTPDECERK